jgi:hypothetical protein
MTPSQFRLVTAPGLILVAFFFGIAGFVMLFTPCFVYWKLRSAGARWWQACFLAICSMYLAAELVLLSLPTP